MSEFLTRKEAIIKGENLTPMSRAEAMLKKEDIPVFTRKESLIKEALNSGGSGGSLETVILRIVYENSYYTDNITLTGSACVPFSESNPNDKYVIAISMPITHGSDTTYPLLKGSVVTFAVPESSDIDLRSAGSTMVWLDENGDPISPMIVSKTEKSMMFIVNQNTSLSVTFAADK